MKKMYNYLMPKCLYLLLALIMFASPVFAQEISITTTNDEAHVLFVEGRELFDNIRFDEAREVFDQALEKDSEFALAHIYRAVVSTTDNEYDTHIKKAVTFKDQASEGEQLLIGAIHANAENKPTEAIALLKEAVEKYPEDKRLHHQLAIFYQGSNMTEEAEQQLKTAINIDEQFAPAYNNLGYLYKDAERYDEAEEAFKNYVALLPEEANPHDSIADLYTKIGNYDLAIEHYNKAMELNPNFYFSQQKIGNNLVFKGLYKDGRQAYEKAITMAPSTSDKIFMHQALANTYLYEDNYEQALKETDAAIVWAENESLPENAATLYQLKALINLERGDITEAEKSMEACNTIVNTQDLTENRKQKLELFTLRNQTIKALKQDDFNEASVKLEKIRTLAEESGNSSELNMYHMLKGITAYEQNDFASAVEELKKSSPNNAYGQYYLAMSYQQSGMDEEARKLFSKISNWNEHSIEYALVRNKANAMAKRDMAIEEK